jgi:hypothetical protein
MTRRNLIVMFLCTELMFQGVAINLIAFSFFHGNLAGQAFVIFLLVIAAAEASLALGLVVLLALVPVSGGPRYPNFPSPVRNHTGQVSQATLTSWPSRIKPPWASLLPGVGDSSGGNHASLVTYSLSRPACLR